jgi:hypothetical protein
MSRSGGTNPTPQHALDLVPAVLLRDLEVVQPLAQRVDVALELLDLGLQLALHVRDGQ